MELGMKVLRFLALTLTFLVVVIGWVFVIGILRYGSVEGFGTRMKRAVAWSRPPVSYTVPAPDASYLLQDSEESAISRTNPTPVTGDLVVSTPVSGASVTGASVVSTSTDAPTTDAPSTETPTTVAPTTDVPTTDVPTTDAPATEPPAAASLTGLRHEWQTWNNCGPATLATYLSYYGSSLKQADIGSVLRRSEDDKNVSPEELQHYALERGMTAQLRVNGTSAMLKALVSAGYPVLIETWLEEHPNDGMGHYRLVTGYDDAQGAWILYDSYVSTNPLQGGKDGADAYAGIWLDYATADAWWKVFNRTYLLVYPPGDEAAIQAILSGAAMRDMLSGDQWSAAESTARAEIALNAQDAFAWFNLGTSLWNLGRAAEAAQAFDQARAIGLPWRMLWYQFAPFPTYLEMGRPNDALTLADSTLANTTSIEEIHYWRGQALQALGNIESARAAYQSALNLYPGYTDAQSALSSLP